MGRRSEYFRDNFKSFWHVCSTTLFYFINFYRYAFLKSESSFSIFFSKVYGGNLRIQFKCRTHKSDYLGCTWKFFLIISLFFFLHFKRRKIPVEWLFSPFQINWKTLDKQSNQIEWLFGSGLFKNLISLLENGVKRCLEAHFLVRGAFSTKFLLN